MKSFGLSTNHSIIPDFIVDFVLPTGAMGNIAGGYMGKKLGMPFGRFCSGVNQNDITHRVIETGQFHKSPQMHKTLSDAINIQVVSSGMPSFSSEYEMCLKGHRQRNLFVGVVVVVFPHFSASFEHDVLGQPYNFERLLFYLTNEKHALVRQLYSVMEDTSKMDLPQELLVKLQSEFSSAVVTDEQLCDTIRHIKATYDYWVDPHTGVAFGAARKMGHLDDPIETPEKRAVALLSTASPCKFEESMTVALGHAGWKEYTKSSEFPEQAQKYMELTETNPALYLSQEGKSLEENQDVWEELARDIIRTL